MNSSPKELPPATETDWVKPVRQALSADFIARHLDSHWRYSRTRNIDVIGVVVDRAYPNKHNTCIIRYDIKLRRQNYTWTQAMFADVVEGDANAYADKIVRKLSSTHRRQLHPGDPMHQVCAFPKLNLVMRFPGLDERIDGLHMLHSPHRVLNKLPLGDYVSELPASAELLAHRLRKRCVIRATYNDTADQSVDTKCVILKFYKRRYERSEKIFEITKSLHRAFEKTTANVFSVAPIHFVENLSAIAMTEVPGQTVVFSDETNARLNANLCGKLLGTLQSSAVHNDVADACGEISNHGHGANEEIDVLDTWVRRTSLVYPEYASQLAAAMQRARAGLENLQTGHTTLLHRDFHEKQVLVCDGNAGLVDLDTLCEGDPAIDVGNFLAHIHLATHQVPSFGTNDCQTICGMFIDAYASEFDYAYDTEFQSRVDSYRDAALLRLTCLSLWQPRWHHITGSLFESIR